MNSLSEPCSLTNPFPRVFSILFLSSLARLEFSSFFSVAAINLSFSLISPSNFAIVASSLPFPPKKFSTPPNINAPVASAPFVFPTTVPASPTAFFAAAPFVAPFHAPENPPATIPPSPPEIPPATAPVISPRVPPTEPIRTDLNPLPASPNPNLVPSASSINLGSSLAAWKHAIISNISTRNVASNEMKPVVAVSVNFPSCPNIPSIKFNNTNAI